VVLADRFELGAPVTAGGMGTVHLGVDRETGRTVAIKVLREGGGQLDVERFVREGVILATLDHPSIVKYIARGTTKDGKHFLVMEWVEGETLQARLVGAGVTAQAAVDIGFAIAGALSVVHQHGLVHRDLKPANVMLLRDGGIKLLDFGIARLVVDQHGLTHTGAMVGTPAYMAPEQALGQKDITPRADVFALGCVLFECATGRPAFSGTQLLAIRTKVILTDPPRPRALSAEVPAELDELIVRMLAKEPQLRPADANEVAAALALVPPIQTGPARKRSQRAVSDQNVSQLTTMSPPGDPAPLISVVLASRAEEDGDEPPAVGTETPRVVADVARLFGGRAGVFPDGAFALSFQNDPVRAVRCAHEIVKRMADVSVVVTTEHLSALDHALDKAVTTLGAATMEMIFDDRKRGVDVDDRTRELVAEEFVVAHDGGDGRITLRPRGE
jgi:eukaryotic-like serine/threonine-protein kinase